MYKNEDLSFHPQEINKPTVAVSVNQQSHTGDLQQGDPWCQLVSFRSSQRPCLRNRTWLRKSSDVMIGFFMKVNMCAHVHIITCTSTHMKMHVWMHTPWKEVELVKSPAEWLYSKIVAFAETMKTQDFFFGLNDLPKTKTYEISNFILRRNM